MAGIGVVHRFHAPFAKPSRPSLPCQPHCCTGAQNQAGQKTVCNSTSIPSGSSKTIQFHYKYVLGSCSKKGQGTGPTLSLAIGSKEVWTKQINTTTEDYPYDMSCGGSPTLYSPMRTATFTVKGPMTGAVVLKAKQADRSIHVVGLGMNYAGMECVDEL